MRGHAAIPGSLHLPTITGGRAHSAFGYLWSEMSQYLLSQEPRGAANLFGNMGNRKAGDDGSRSASFEGGGGFSAELRGGNSAAGWETGGGRRAVPEWGEHPNRMKGGGSHSFSFFSFFD